MMPALDPRQRAMLAEMGVRVWQAANEEPTPASTPAAVAVARIAVPSPAPALTPARVRQAPPSREVASLASADPAASLGDLPEGLSHMDWHSLKNAAAECRACGLCEHRQQTVFAEGAPVEGQHTDWLIIGDAPNDNENTSGSPFSGPEADLLDAMLLAMGLKRPTLAGSSESVVLVNALKCKPPAQRNPHANELAQCRHFLNRQIELLQPRVILALGRMAAMAVLHDSLPNIHAVPLGKLRGQVQQAHGIPVIVSYHPANLMRTPGDKAKAWGDLCLAMTLLRSGNR
ncbi:MAG: uracil-DNA glycosylase family protein [Limnohabitans sp.]